MKARHRMDESASILRLGQRNFLQDNMFLVDLARGRSVDAYLCQELVPGAILLAFVVFLSSFAGAKKFAMKAAHGRRCICMCCASQSLQCSRMATRSEPSTSSWRWDSQTSLAPSSALCQHRWASAAPWAEQSVLSCETPLQPLGMGIAHQAELLSVCCGMSWVLSPEAGIKSQLGANILVGATCWHSVSGIMRADLKTEARRFGGGC